jgi:hypothetical protein
VTRAAWATIAATIGVAAVVAIAIVVLGLLEQVFRTPK